MQTMRFKICMLCSEKGCSGGPGAAHLVSSLEKDLIERCIEYCLTQSGI